MGGIIGGAGGGIIGGAGACWLSSMEACMVTLWHRSINRKLLTSTSR
jgi:hypothetical protein